MLLHQERPNMYRAVWAKVQPAVEGSGYFPLFSTYEAAPGEPCSGLGSSVQQQ